MYNPRAVGGNSAQPNPENDKQSLRDLITYFEENKKQIEGRLKDEEKQLNSLSADNWAAYLNIQKNIGLLTLALTIADPLQKLLQGEVLHGEMITKLVNLIGLYKQDAGPVSRISQVNILTVNLANIYQPSR